MFIKAAGGDASTPPAPPLTVVQPGEGRAGESSARIGVVFKLWGADTGGAVSIVEHPFPVGALRPAAPAHPGGRVLDRHRGRDRLPLRRPRGRARPGRLHHQAARRAARDVERRDVPARMIEVISPGRVRALLPGDDRLAAAGPPLFADVLELGAKYGLEFGEPEWLPDVIGRYGLTPPPRRDS